MLPTSPRSEDSRNSRISDVGFIDELRRRAGGTIRLDETGAHNYARGGVNVQPWLIDSVREATRVLPQGYTASVISTVDPRTKTGTVWHPSGRAIDIQIFDPQGNKVPNIGGPNTPGWSLYENMGAAAKAYAVQNYPNEKFVWGGHFNTGTPYDRMHFQSTGTSARNFTPRQIAAASETLRATTQRPPADIPNVDVASVPPGASPAAYTGSGVKQQSLSTPAPPVGDQPWQPTNAQQQDLVAGITTPPAAAAAAVGGVPAASPPTPLPRPRPASAPGGSLGDAIIAAMGPRGQGMSTYEDPTTHHQIMNPGGSGESAMGLTRDLGPLSTARVAPAPTVRAGSPAPPAARPANTPSEPVAQRPNFPDVSLAEGPTPPGAISPMQRGTVPDILAPTSTTGDMLGGMFDVKPIGQQRPLGDFKPQRAAWSPFETAPPDVLPMPVRQPVPQAPPEAAALAVPERTPPQMTPQQQADASRAFSSGGTPMNPYQPTTVSQQLNGTSPFNPEPPPGSPFASNTLLPFQQWPPVGWGGEGFAGWGGPASFDFGAFG